MSSAYCWIKNETVRTQVFHKLRKTLIDAFPSPRNICKADVSKDRLNCALFPATFPSLLCCFAITCRSEAECHHSTMTHLTNIASLFWSLCLKTAKGASNKPQITETVYRLHVRILLRAFCCAVVTLWYLRSQKLQIIVSSWSRWPNSSVSLFKQSVSTANVYLNWNSAK